MRSFRQLLHQWVRKQKLPSIRTHSSRKLSTFPYNVDRYQGVHVDLKETVFKERDSKPCEFEMVLKENLTRWTAEDKAAVWLKVPIEQSHMIPVAADLGFVFHHAEAHYSMLCNWLSANMESKLPKFASHQIGVAGCVVKEDTNEILVVKDRNRPFTMWKFPGGLSELGEDIAITAEREVLEETGVKAKFSGVLAFRQQHNQPGAYGRSDLYFVCHMTPLSDRLNPCKHEIEACEWMDLDELEKAMSTSAITLRTLQLIRLGLAQGFDSVCLTSQEFQSVYKGLSYQLYHRKLPSGSQELTNYVHTVSEPETKFIRD